MATYHIHGSVSEGYENVKQMFEDNFRKGMEKEAQLCVYIGEKKVVDLWGMMEQSTNYDGDSLAPVFSSGKSLASLCMATLVEKNLLNYSDKVVDHWPEFGDGDQDKKLLTIAQILKHEGGMPYFSKSLTLDDLQSKNIKQNSIGQVIEKEALHFPPTHANTTREYHTFTRGLILNEIFRRVDPNGRTIGECLRSDISLPLNAHAYVGLCEKELKKVVEISTLPLSRVLLESMKLKSMGRKTVPSFIDLVKMSMSYLPEILRSPNCLSRVPFLEDLNEEDTEAFVSLHNNEKMRTGESPSHNAYCSANGLARIAAMMANKGILEGVRIFSEEIWGKIHDCSDTKKMYLFINTCFSQGGVNLFQADSIFSTQSHINREGFVGWFGCGGSVLQWHPKYKVGFSYVPTFIAWEDFLNTKAAFLQKEVIDCTVRMNEK